jgi:hypothetical protein
MLIIADLVETVLQQVISAEGRCDQRRPQAYAGVALYPVMGDIFGREAE